MATLRFFSELTPHVPIVIPGDAVEVQFSPIQASQGGITVPVSELLGMLNVLTSGVNRWTSCMVHLYLDTLSPVQDTPLADFTTNEATFTGYAAQSLVWLAPENNGLTAADIPSQLLQFLSTAVPTPQNVAGFYVTA